MRFLANENFPGPAVRALEASAHDVVWVRLVMPGATDEEYWRELCGKSVFY